MSIALELAKRITALNYGNLPPAAIRWAKVGILDTVGVTLAGSREDTARLAGQALGSNQASCGPSRTPGRGGRPSALGELTRQTD